ncbi:MAG: class I SAM-dependent methyltransferase [Gammaproteobacteria bacterium]
MITERAAEFYAKSASNHDRVYDKPERQEDLEELHEQVENVLAGHRVLELACGTGYWTRVIAEVAEQVVAIDINPEMIALARLRQLPEDVVTLRVADAFDLPDDLGEGQFTAVFIGFWWSHVRRAEQDRFLTQLRRKVGKDVLLFMVDDDFVEDSSESVARTDADGNTYQIRVAPDGERYEIPKNYPSDSALRKRLAGAAREIRIERSEFYWMLTCRLK